MASIISRSGEFAGTAKAGSTQSCDAPPTRGGGLGERAPGVPTRHLMILCTLLLFLWAICNAGVWAISTLAAGAWPAASLALGWPLGLCVALVVWLGGGGFWRLVIAAGWCLVFPIATPHYFEISAKLGLFLGRVPNLEAGTLAHAAVFFLLPTAVTVATIAWAARWEQASGVLVLTVVAGAGTALQVCWCGQNLIDNPLLQVWVWNGVMISGLCVAGGIRLHELMQQPAE